MTTVYLYSDRYGQLNYINSLYISMYIQNKFWVFWLMYISAIKVNITHSYTDGITASANGSQHSWVQTGWITGEEETWQWDMYSDHHNRHWQQHAVTIPTTVNGQVHRDMFSVYCWLTLQYLITIWKHLHFDVKWKKKSLSSLDPTHQFKSSDAAY